MNDRSNEIIKQLNRLRNDRSLPTQVRNKINDAARHIKELQLKLTEVTNFERATKIAKEKN